MRKIFTFLFIILNVYFAYSQGKRYILVEHFTNTELTSVVSLDSDFYTNIYPVNKENIHHITYHIPVSSDANSQNCAFFNANPIDNAGIAGDYPSITTVPRMVLNGNVIPIQSDLVTQAQIDNEAFPPSTSLYYSKIEFEPAPAGGNFYNAIATIKTEGPIDTTISYTLKAAITEKGVNYTGGNNNSVHKNVMRMMMPDHSGQVFYPAENGNAFVYPFFDLEFDPSWNVDSMCVLSWIINDLTGEVINSGSSHDPQPLEVSVNNSVTIQSVSCFNECDAQIKVDVEGGQPPYTFTWTPNVGNSDLVTNICPGSYSVIVSDANNQTSTANNINIINPQALFATFQVLNDQDTTCTGAAFASLVGGTLPVTTTWEDLNGNLISTNEPNLTNTCGGAFLYTAIDNNGCNFEEIVNIPIDIGDLLCEIEELEDVSCTDLSDGSINMVVLNQIGNVSYTWTDVYGAPVGQTEDLVNLDPGFYYLVGSDDFGQVCNVTVEVENPAPLFGNLILNDDFDDTCNGSASISVTGGNPPYIVQWETNITGPALPNLCAGEYEVLVTDNNFCTYEETFTISPNTSILTIMVNDTSDISCSGFNDGTIDFNIVGGAEPYTAGWTVTDQSGTTTPLPQYADLLSVNVLSEGLYTVTVIDSNSVNTTLQFQVDNPDPLVVSVATQDYCYGGDGSEELGLAIATVTGGTGDYQFQWNTGQVNDTVNLQAGLYNVTIFDENACQVSESNVFINEINPDSCVTPIQDYTTVENSINVFNSGLDKSIKVEITHPEISYFDFYLLDANGKMINRQRINSVIGIQQIDIEEYLSTGVYIALINTKLGNVQRKLVLGN